ncbi:cell division protein FtsA [Candidatus Babeliales bacterium]|nr:cell division protein FtsA [Candidatus Babeliales bacterium]
MSATQSGKIMTAIDIGTTKICALIAHVESPGKIEVLGIGHHPSKGLKRGIVVDIKTAAESIRSAVSKAEEESGIKIAEATVGLSGAHIQSFNARGCVPIKYQDVDENDIERVLESAKNIPIPEGREILHVIPQYFRIDGQETVQESLGMHGSRLEAQVHIVTGAIWSAQNIIRACELAGITTNDIVLEQIASAEAVLSASERELGSAIIDIGGGTSDFAIYKNGRVIHSKVIPVAGTHFTHDLALCLNLPIGIAKELKHSHGSVSSTAKLDALKPIQEVLPPKYQSQEIDLFKIIEILNPRATELFEFVQDEIIQYKLAPLMRSGLVLTGGGSLLRGVETLAQDMFNIPTRVGMPHADNEEIERIVPRLLKTPIYSTAYGILLFSARGGRGELSEGSSKSLFSRVFKKMKDWIYDFL